MKRIEVQRRRPQPGNGGMPWWGFGVQPVFVNVQAIQPPQERTRPRRDGDDLTDLVDRLVEGIADRVSRKLSERSLPENGSRKRRLLTVAEAAAYLGRSKRSVEHLIADRAIPVVRQGRRVFLEQRDLDEWVQSSKE